MQHVGVERFAGVASDSTSNTKLARILICKEIPTVIDIRDSVHHTNLAIKDICGLKCFRKV